MTTNIVTAAFGAFKMTRTRQLYQYDYGQILRFKGIELPATYTVHFSNQQIGGEAVKQVGNADGVLIPDAMLISGQNVYAWVFLHVGADDGETMYAVTIPVQQRPRPTEEEPTPVQQGLIEQAIAVLNAAVEQTGQDVVDTNAAKEAAEAAQTAAEMAQGLAEDAQSAAEAAQSAAESAHAGAEAAMDAAQAAHVQAEASEQAAAGSAADAYRDAERAEQAASTAGYLDVEIVDGDLIYTRTDAVDVDFELIDGDLVMEVI